MSYQASLPVALAPLAMAIPLLVAITLCADALYIFDSSWIALIVLVVTLGEFSVYLMWFRVTLNTQEIEVRGLKSARYEISRVSHIAVVHQRYGKIARIAFNDGRQLEIGGWIGRFDDLVGQLRDVVGPGVGFERTSF